MGIKGKWSVTRLDPPQILEPAEGVDAFQGLDWSADPLAFYHHDVKISDGTQVWIKAGDVPILVVRKMGKGYVAAFLSGPLGKPKEGTVGYWEWEDWPKLLMAVSEKLMELE